MIGEKSDFGDFDRIEHQNHFETIDERDILSDQSGELFIEKQEEEEEEEKIEFSETNDHNEEEKFEKIVLEKHQFSQELEEEDLDLSNGRNNHEVSMIQKIKDLGYAVCRLKISKIK